MRHSGSERRINPHLWGIIALSAAGSLFYYLPVLAGVLGWGSLQGTLKVLHDFYGIDFYALVFFIPVVYAAYVVGVKGAVAVSFAVMFILLPYAFFFAAYPNALLRPTAFAIILSAVGAAIAMLQRGDEQRRRSMDALKYLYDVGKSAEDSTSLEGFLDSAVELVGQDLPREARLRITVRARVFQSPGFSDSAKKVGEDLVVGGEGVGRIEMYSLRNSSNTRELYPLVRALAERIGGAVRRLELEDSLKHYYEQLEEMVEERTRDLEKAQDKLIRSERLAAVGELASGVGHELRNPLNVIRNCAYLLNMTLVDKADPEVVNTLKLLDQQVDISNKIVTDLLTFTRVSPPSRSRVELHRLIKDSLSWVVAPGEVSILTDFNGHSPVLWVDAEQVGRSFANIVSNAYQAVNGKGELRIHTGTENGTAWVGFEDTGCGIPPENMTKIFEPLFTTKRKGIGLGLAITRRLVEQNGGRVEVASQVGKGTTFMVKLPLYKEEVIKDGKATSSVSSR